MIPPNNERFRKTQRLRKRPEFQRTQRFGCRRNSEHLIVYARPNEHEYSRIGLTVSRKVGNAAQRNWWKRRLREIFRQNQSAMPQGFDFVVIVKAQNKPLSLDFQQLRTEFIRLAATAADHALRKHKG